jgi:hypothetical protein
MLKKSPTNIKIIVIDGIILVKKKIYLSQKLKKKAFRQYHNIKTAEH